MSPKKGFDPLASLFDGPDLRDFNEPVSEEIERPREGTDPGISMGAQGPLAALRGEDVPLPAFISESEHTDALPEDPGDVQDTLLMKRPLELMPPDEVTIMTARPDLDDMALPATASIPARHREPVTEHTQVDKAELARALAKAAMSAAPTAVTGPRQEPTPATEERDKLELASALARAAMAKAPRAVDVPRKVAPEAAPPAPEPPPAAVEPEKKVRKRRGRGLAGLAERAQRPMSALEAAAQAARAQDERKEARGPELVKSLRRILVSELKGARGLQVVNAIPMDDRPLLGALWKGHRATFAARGDLSGVIATSHVIGALQIAAPGTLVAAIVETETSEYLVWVDTRNKKVLAAFPDARSWYAQARS